MSVAENIKKIRESQDMSQADLAKAAGYKTRSSITKIENGTADPSQNALRRIASALGVKATDLLEENKEVSEKRKILISLAENCPESKIDLIIRLVQSVVEDAGKED